MTRLSIQSRNEINKISIHLRPGQSCTIGSSGAADYCLDEQSISGVYCRLCCLSSGGFIECIDPSKTIVVNQVSKNRSRLVNGDSLTIGRIKLDVEMPQVEISNAEFHVNFEDEDSPSTISDDSNVISATDGDSRGFFDMTPSDIERESIEDSDPPRQRTDSIGIFDDFDESDEDSPSNPRSTPEPTSRFDPQFEDEDDEDDEPAFSFGPSRFDDDVSEDNVSGDNVSGDNDSGDRGEEADPNPDRTPNPFHQPPSQQPFELDSNQTADESDDRPSTSKEGDGKSGGSPLFAFDSNDPDDVEFNEEDIADIYDDSKIESFPTMSVSIADSSDSTDPDSISVSLDHDVDLSLLDGSFDDQAGNSALVGGQDTGKFWRWQGRSLLPAIDYVLDAQPHIKAFRVRGIQTQPEAISTLRSHTFLEEDSALFLITSFSMDELQNAIRVNRWDDRMGHPRALKMFLEYAPNSVLVPFFTAVDSVLLVEDGEPLLIRRQAYLT